MRLSGEECWVRAAGTSVARLATTGTDLSPHLVPVTFALSGDAVVLAVDQKPKTTTRLRRLRNIAENPRVSLLWDHYEDDWTQLWWVRADGTATVHEEAEDRTTAIRALREKYPQYREEPPLGPAIVITVERWSGWASRA